MTAYPEDTPVLVRFPLPGQSSTDRDSWPWLRGTITAVCGEDEWQVIVTDPRMEQNGTYPLAHRDASELRHRGGQLG